MVINTLRRTLAAAAITWLAGCSGTTLSGAWKSPEFHGQVGKIYLVGISQSEVNRRIFETRFAQELASYGTTGIPSYTDLGNPGEADIATVAARVKANGADSVLMTRLLGKRTEQTVIPGYVRSYRSWPGYSYAPSRQYRYWGNYYNRCCAEVIYEPPTVRQFEIATIEANLYAADSGELIWAAQLETLVERDLQRMVDDFVRTVIEDLSRQGLI